MINTLEWEKEYELGQVPDCPHCSQEDTVHHCRHCHRDIFKDLCWKNDGYCERCFDYIRNKIPKIEAEKKRLGVQCKCLTESCAKCLRGNCKDDNCPVHSESDKAKFRGLACGHVIPDNASFYQKLKEHSRRWLKNLLP